MTTMNTSMMMDKIGMTIVHAILLAGLPIGVITAIVQSF